MIGEGPSDDCPGKIAGASQDDEGITALEAGEVGAGGGTAGVVEYRAMIACARSSLRTGFRASGLAATMGVNFSTVWYALESCFSCLRVKSPRPSL